MPVYEYKGKTLGGKQVQGELKAKNRAELERFLRGNRILVTNVSKKPQQIQIKIGSGIKNDESQIHIERLSGTGS